MKFNKIITGLACMACVMFASSCLNSNDNSDVVYRQSFSKFFNAEFQSGATTPVYKTGVGYEIEYNYSQPKASINITGLTVGSATYTSLKFVDVPWSADTQKGWKKIELVQVTPESSTPAPTFTSLKLNVLDRYLMVNNQQLFFPLTTISYDLGHTMIFSYPNAVMNQGETVVTAGDGSQYTSKGTDDGMLYTIQLYDATKNVDLNNPDTRKANLSIYSAKFAANMPAMNMIFQGIPFDVNQYGKVVMTCDELTPAIINADGTTVPYDAAKITNLSCLTDAANNMTLTFTCTITLKMGEQSYNVVATCTQP